MIQAVGNLKRVGHSVIPISNNASFHHSEPTPLSERARQSIQSIDTHITHQTYGLAAANLSTISDYLKQVQILDSTGRRTLNRTEDPFQQLALRTFYEKTKELYCVLDTMGSILRMKGYDPDSQTIEDSPDGFSVMLEVYRSLKSTLPGLNTFHGVKNALSEISNLDFKLITRDYDAASEILQRSLRVLEDEGVVPLQQPKIGDGDEKMLLLYSFQQGVNRLKSYYEQALRNFDFENVARADEYLSLEHAIEPLERYITS